MPECSVVIPNPEGLQARNSAKFVKLTNKFISDIFVSKEDETCNAKSIMGLMMLAGEQGAVLTVFADGEDAVPALEAIKDLVESGFQLEG